MQLVTRRHQFMNGDETAFADEDEMEEELSAIAEDLFAAQDDYQDAAKEMAQISQEKKEQRLFYFRARRRRAIKDYVLRRQKQLTDKVCRRV